MKRKPIFHIFITLVLFITFTFPALAAGEGMREQRTHVISVDKHFTLEKNIDLTITSGDRVVFTSFDKRAYIVFSNGKRVKNTCKSGFGFEYEAASDDFVSRLSLGETASICFSRKGRYPFYIGGTDAYKTQAVLVRGIITVQ